MKPKHPRVFCLTLLLIIAATTVVAQNAVTTSSGTINNVPAFNGATSLGSSAIWVSGSNAGIGTATPNGVLHVAGTGSNVLVLGESTTNGKQILLGITPDDDGVGTIQAVYQHVTYIPLLLNPNGGSVEIGSAALAGGVMVAAKNIDPNGYTLPNLANTGKMLIGWNRSSGGGEFDFIANRAAGGTGGYGFYDYTNAGVVNNLMMLLGNGNLGVGTTSPGAKLEVNGNIKLTSGAGASVTYSDSTVQSTAWTGVLSGGDYAESVDVTGERVAFEPGDLLVIDPKEHGHFEKATTAYSTLVGGVYATNPGVTGRRQPRSKSKEDEVPMAMVGIVPTKVSTENGPIHDGDLLVSSSTPGYAMKGTDHNRMMGAVIGKALASMEAGSGVIEVLISLQ